MSLLFLGALVAAVDAVTLRHDLPLQADRSARHAGCTGGCDNVTAELLVQAKLYRPSRGKWEAQLKKMAKDASDDPCNATIVATSSARHFGFGARINGFSDELLIAMYLGSSFSLCDSEKDHFIQNVWSPHFQNVAEFPVCKSTKKACQHGDTWDTLHIGAKLRRQLVEDDSEYLDDLQHFMYKKIYTLSQATQERVDQRLQAAGLVPGEPYVAVHVRHGDKDVHEAKWIETEEYADRVRPFLAQRTSAGGGSAAQRLLRGHVLRELEAAGASTVFVSSDDEEAAEEIRFRFREMRLGRKVRVVQQVRSSEEGYEKRGYDDEEVLMAVLTDVEALRRASAFVGTASSNIGRLAYFLRPRGSVSVSLDENGDWLRTREFA